MDRPDFILSEQKRIAYIHNELMDWLKARGFEMFELNRAVAMHMRLQDEKKHEEAIRGRIHGAD
jgi:hypothetical protein